MLTQNKWNLINLTTMFAYNVIEEMIKMYFLFVIAVIFIVFIFIVIEAWIIYFRKDNGFANSVNKKWNKANDYIKKVWNTITKYHN
jgi:ABC-type phosphate transport system permease subunit